LNFIVTNDNNGLFSVQPAIAANGTLTYSPVANASGSATVTVSIHDDGGIANGGVDTSTMQSFTITVTSVNDAPSFTKDANQTVLEDAGAQTVANWASAISAGPSNESGQTLNFIVTNDNNGLFSVQPAIAANGTLTYTPVANASGSATVTVSIHDNGGIANGGVDTSATQTFTITVTAVNDPPTAVDDAYGVHRDVTLNLSAPGVLTNDSDIDGDSLTAILVSDVSHGTLTLNPSGWFTYTPATDYAGSDFFTYRAFDGTDYSDTATVSITVHAVNHAPEAVGDTYTVAEDAALSVPIGTSVLSNDTDSDTDPLKAVVVANVSHGVLVFNDDGSFTYTPAANFAGTDSFTYKVNDGLADSGAATVTITVSPVNDLPVATADAYQSLAGIALSVSAPGPLGNDSDIDGDALTAVLVSNVSHGTLTLNADGSFAYTAESGFAGTDTFTYKATDGTGDSATVTVTIEVTQPEPPTIASVSEPSGRQGGSLTVIITGTKLAGATVLDFGPGVTVNSFKADSPTQITAEITLDSDAVPGTRDVLVTTPEGTYTLEGAFTVKKVSSGGAPVWIWPMVALAVIAAGAGGFLLFRRRAKPG
jgi:VCBS repeat-containing protein